MKLCRRLNILIERLHCYCLVIYFLLLSQSKIGFDFKEIYWAFFFSLKMNTPIIRYLKTLPTQETSLSQVTLDLCRWNHIALYRMTGITQNVKLSIEVEDSDRERQVSNIIAWVTELWLPCCGSSINIFTCFRWALGVSEVLIFSIPVRNQVSYLRAWVENLVVLG